MHMPFLCALLCTCEAKNIGGHHHFKLVRVPVTPTV